MWSLRTKIPEKMAFFQAKICDMKSQKTEIYLKIIKFCVLHPVLMFSIKDKCTTLQNNMLNFRCVFFEKFYKEIFCNQIFPFLVTAILVTIVTFFKCYKINNKLQNSLKFGVHPCCGILFAFPKRILHIRSFWTIYRHFKFW